MKLMLTGLPIILLTLNGCAGAIIADASRNESRAAIAGVMAQDRPQVNSTEAATCVQKAMTIGETLKLGTADNHAGVSPENRVAIESYAARPEATACLAALAAAPQT